MDNVLLVGAILLGACVGSFLNVVILRLPHGQMLARGRRSKCPHCHRQIAAYDNVPVVSWLLLRGRCRACRGPISPRYPLVELLGALAFAALWLWPPSGRTFGPPPFDLQALLAFALHAYFLSFLIASTFIDLDHQILPDALNFPAIGIGLLGALLVPGLPGEPVARELAPAVQSLLWSLGGVLVGGGLTRLVVWLGGKVFRQEAMGLGDVKFMAAIGAFVGPTHVLIVFLLGCAIGSVFGGLNLLVTGRSKIPFGPHLAAGAVLMLFFGTPIVEFVTVTWPQWQAQHASHPAVLGGIALLCVVSLFVLIRRGRGPS